MREFLAKAGSKGGSVTVKKYGRRQMRIWGKLGGRPPKKKSELLNSRVIVNMTRAERRRLEMEARKAGVSVSVYLLNFWRKGR